MYNEVQPMINNEIYDIKNEYMTVIVLFSQ